jgi:diadenosine tetraphosphatase ApaH/serine/threonine PP2A family protein phosphatase
MSVHGNDVPSPSAGSPSRRSSWLVNPLTGGFTVLSLLRRLEQSSGSSGGGPSELPTNAIMEILSVAERLLRQEPNLVTVPRGKAVVVGDLHGNFNDFLQGVLSRHCEFLGSHGEGQDAGSATSMFHCNLSEDFTLKQKLVFLGNYVNHGNGGPELMLTLLLLKIHRPDCVYLLRGNHESKIMGEAHGFKQECDERYGKGVFPRFCQVFQAMPLAAVVNLESSPGGRVLCVHGGISKNVQSLDSINAIDRAAEPARGTPLSDVLWSDPAVAEVARFGRNIDRGCGDLYGHSAVQDFLAANATTCIVRGHQVYEKGYHMHFGGSVISIFSCPNKAGSHGNEGAVLVLNEQPLPHSEDSTNVYPLPAIRGNLYSYEHWPLPPPPDVIDRSARFFTEIGEVAPYMPHSGTDLVKEAMAFAKLRHIASGRCVDPR